MSDDIPVDLCHGKMNASFRLPPTEVWTDVFNLLPRHILVKQVQPANHWFKEICDRNVKCVHLITEADQFLHKLKKGDPEAKKQVKDLAGNKCKLADHFRLKLELDRIKISYKSKAILRHCSDLFNGCVVSLNIRWINSLTVTQSLDHLERPVAIHINQNVDQITTFWHHPTIRDCSRILLSVSSPLSDANLKRTYVAIADWLHHRPMDEEDAHQQVRYVFFMLTSPSQSHFDWLHNQCLEALRNSQCPADRRRFSICLVCRSTATDLGNRFGRNENEKTGEVLRFGRVTARGLVIDRIRRRLANEVADETEEFRLAKEIEAIPKVLID